MKKQLFTEIQIDAPAATVWRVLTDFGAYPDWNPFIRRISGKTVVGEKLKAYIEPSGARGLTFKPKVLVADKDKELRWLGKILVSGLFDGEHFFKIEALTDSSVKFIQGENFSGLLVRVFAKSLDKDTLRGFNEMNEALKTLAEGQSSGRSKVAGR
jgi:hypothetical protein